MQLYYVKQVSLIKPGKLLMSFLALLLKSIALE